MRISTSLPDGNWREVAEAARAFEELGIDEAAAHEVRHDSFATLVRCSYREPKHLVGEGQAR